MTNDELFSIGELAERTGVPVKTIRHYADEGILPPSAVSDAGYRRYSHEDARRLRMVRSLRALGFSLPAIASMLDGTRDPADVAALQLDLVETQLHALERQRTILRAAAALQDRSDVLRRLETAYAAASLGAAERAHRLDRWLARTGSGGNDDAGRGKIRSMVLDGLPVELDEPQLEAWIRLSALLDDGGLLDTLAAQHEPFGSDVTPEARAAFGAQMMTLYGRLYPLVAQRVAPGDERVRALVDVWVGLFAKVLNRVADPALERWLLAFAERTNDPRIERFWKDVATLRGLPAMPPITAAQSLLIDG
ncbi:MAG TPA: MerR family transcriptional regulator, partial [Candidatus Acidoferrales bacterium]|nr:MerR family transcriptional regulator [Candidatus Acidoferrales bacterium]